MEKAMKVGLKKSNQVLTIFLNPCLLFFRYGLAGRSRLRRNTAAETTMCSAGDRILIGVMLGGLPTRFPVFQGRNLAAAMAN
jgi:hypothetical protein